MRLQGYEVVNLKLIHVTCLGSLIIFAHWGTSVSGNLSAG